MSSDGRKRRRRGPAASLILVALLAGGVRLAYLADMKDSPFPGTPLGEAAENLTAAKAIAEAGSLGEEPLERPPLYPLLLSLAVKAGDEGSGARRAQALSGVIVACLVLLGGRFLLGRAEGLLAGIIAALYGPAVYWDAQLVSASLALCLFTCYWLLCVKAAKRRLLPLWLAAGLFLGLMADARVGGFVLIAPALALVLSKASSEGRARTAGAIALIVVGAAAATYPFVSHNWRAGAAGVGVATSGGMQFFIANNPNATGLPPGVAGRNTWWHGGRYAAVEASAQRARPLNGAEISRFWFWRGLGYIIRSPLSYLKLTARKLGHFWSRHELDAGPGSVFSSAKWAPWSAPLMHAFAVLGPLAIAGLVTLRRRHDLLSTAFPLLGALLMALVYTAPATTRLLAVPSIALLSSAFLVDLAARLRVRRLKSTASALLAPAVAAAAVNVAAPRISGAAPSEASGQRLLGIVYEMQGRGSLALSQFDKAKGMAPRDPACRLSLASMLASDGVARDAEREFLAAAVLDTLSPAPHVGLANLYRRNGLYEQSLASLKAALRRAPYDVGILISLGRSCVDMGLYEQAEKYLRRALEMDPENVSAIDGLLELRDRGVILRVDDKGTEPETSIKGRIQKAMALLRRGDMKASRAILDKALKTAPDDLDLVFADATWHLNAGDPQKAIQGYERCYKQNPKNMMVMNNLAAAYTQTGRTKEAVDLWRRILAIDPANAKARANLKRVEAKGTGSISGTAPP